MESRGQFTFYRSFWDAIRKLKKADRLSAFEAICAYALDGDEIPKTESADALFILIKPVLDTASRKSEGSKTRARQRKDPGKTPARQEKDPGMEGEIEKEKEIEIEKELEIESEGENDSSPPIEGHTRAAAKKSRQREDRHKYGEFGWVRLTDEERARLVMDLGAEETDRCIRYIDEAAQSSGNKNKWKDWNLVIRRCSRENWGRRVERGLSEPAAAGDRGGDRDAAWGISGLKLD